MNVNDEYLCDAPELFEALEGTRRQGWLSLASRRNNDLRPESGQLALRSLERYNQTSANQTQGQRLLVLFKRQKLKLQMVRKNLRPTYLGACNDVTDHRAPPASRWGRPDCFSRYIGGEGQKARANGRKPSLLNSLDNSTNVKGAEASDIIALE